MCAPYANRLVRLWSCHNRLDIFAFPMITQKQAPRAVANPLAYLLLSFTALCWGANAIFGRLAVGEVSPMALTMLRWLIAPVLLVVAHRQLRRDWPALRRQLPFLAIMGALGLTAFNAVYYIAAHWTSAINIGIVQGALPGFVLIGAFAVYGTRVSGLQIGGVVVTMLGVVLIGTGGNLARIATLEINRGDLLIIVACALYAGYTVALKRGPAVSALSLFTVLAGAAFVASIPLVMLESWLGYLQWPTPRGWIIVGLVFFFPSFLAQIFFIRGVAMIGPGRAGVFINLVPVFASILAVAVLGETFALFQAFALALVLGGIWLSERGKGGA